VGDKTERARESERVRIHAADDELIELLAFLRSQPDATFDIVGPGVVEVSLLGSYSSEAMELEVALRWRAWEVARGTSADRSSLP
jgi:hypothetical protein